MMMIELLWLLDYVRMFGADGVVLWQIHGSLFQHCELDERLGNIMEMIAIL